MTVIWLNGTVGAGKSVVGRALAGMLPHAVFVDGDEVAPEGVAAPARWRIAVDALVRRLVRQIGRETLVVAYPLARPDFLRVRAACGRAGRLLVVVTLATPLAIVLRGRGGRRLDADEGRRVRAMWSQGYHRRPFAAFTLANARPPPRLTARRIACRVGRLRTRLFLI